jgi:hypothetical protein
MSNIETFGTLSQTPFGCVSSRLGFVPDGFFFAVERSTPVVGILNRHS